MRAAGSSLTTARAPVAAAVLRRGGLPPAPATLVLDAVARAFGLSVAAITAKDRTAAVVRARNVAAWLLHHRPVPGQVNYQGAPQRRSFPAVAALVGLNDHSSAAHAVARAEEMAARDAELAAVMLDLAHADLARPDQASARAPTPPVAAESSLRQVAERTLAARRLRHTVPVALDEEESHDAALDHVTGSKRLAAAIRAARAVTA